MQKKISAILWIAIVAAIGWSCTAPTVSAKKSIYDIDSLVNAQIGFLLNSKAALNKTVELGTNKSEARYVPDSLQWSNELEIFRQLDQINKASFSDAYVVSERRDTNSNLTVREVRSQRPVPVSSIRFYYLGNQSDLRKIEALITEDNPLYSNDRQLLMEFERIGNRSFIHRFLIAGRQKMVMDDSARFIISGEVAP